MALDTLQSTSVSSRASLHPVQQFRSYGTRFDDKSYGRGVCLSPANVPMESVKKSLPDPDGLRHVLLCRVILGRPEIVSYGSQKDQPSLMEFNSGVDNLSSPTNWIHVNSEFMFFLCHCFKDSLDSETHQFRMLDISCRYKG